jgi:hypothetical protein
MSTFLVICIGFIPFCINAFTKSHYKYQALWTAGCIVAAIYITETNVGNDEAKAGAASTESQAITSNQ